MLKNLIEVSSELPTPIVNESTFGDFQLPNDLARKLEKSINLKSLKIDKNTSTYKTTDNTNPQWVIFPNQYFVFASHFYNFANELIKYFIFLENLQEICVENGLIDTDIFYGKWNEIKTNIEENSKLLDFFDNDDDLELFCRFIDKVDDTYRLKGKSILNDNKGQGPISIRGPSGGCFSSIILKCTNMPDVSAQALGDIVLGLINKKDIYLELTEYCNKFEHKRIVKTITVNSDQKQIPKPFILLAGISGTGKTRFVREQAAVHCNGDLSNYCLIPVRPDWHEPSDLLGYISRIGPDGSRYVVTDLLRFVVKVWQNAWASATAESLACKAPEEMTPYWLCLDEMNLAPVEQYFADYLSVLETRKWENSSYSCDPLLKSETIRQLASSGQRELRKDLKLDNVFFDDLWEYFINVGIPLPPNLIIAGTVNMDETTHGFSRKVIDRAYTIDFGVFYPNIFPEYFKSTTVHKTLSFPVLSQVTTEDLKDVESDPEGANSINFLIAINAILEGTPFELAYRALNELLLAVVCFNPQDEAELQAVWDDFLMSKVLPRIDGDLEKLKSIGTENSLLNELLDALELQFKDIWSKKRPDLLREADDGGLLEIDSRAKQKLEWMQNRLDTNGFTTFWP